jgi:small GTP-binding protein
MGLKGLIEGVRLRKKIIYVKIYGLAGSGKSSIVRSLLMGDLATVRQTHGFEVTSVPITEYNFELWDIAGSEEDRQFWTNYLVPADAIIWVVDSSDPGSLGQSKEAFDELLVNMDEKNPRASILVAMNPHDLSNQMTVEEVSAAFDLRRIESRACACAVCNVRHRKTILRVLRWIRDDFLEKRGV